MHNYLRCGKYSNGPVRNDDHFDFCPIDHSNFSNRLSLLGGGCCPRKNCHLFLRCHLIRPKNVHRRRRLVEYWNASLCRDDDDVFFLVHFTRSSLNFNNGDLTPVILSFPL